MKTGQKQTASSRTTRENPEKMRFHRWLLSSVTLLLFPATLRADDTITSAIAIRPGEVAAAISPVNDVDYFKFTISSPQMVTITTKASSVGTAPTETLLHLYDSTGNEMAWVGNGTTPQLTQLLQAGKYYVRVSAISNISGTYKLVLQTQSGATPIDDVIHGNLDVPNDWETFKFTVNSYGKVHLRTRRPRISSPSINLSMRVRNEAGSELFWTVAPTAAFEDTLSPGNYFVTITSASSGDFSLKLTTPDNALPVSEGTTSAAIGVPRDHDYYKFTVPGSVPRSIRFRTSGSAHLGLLLQNEFGASVDFFGMRVIPDHDHEVSLDPGIYFLLAYGNAESGPGAHGDYRLTLSGITPAAPEISVQQPAGSNLADGKSRRAFGATVAGSKKGITKTFVIRNSGTAILTGIKISKGGKHKGDFQIKTQPASSLAAGEQTPFKVTFMPKSRGSKTASLRIASNDTNENPFDITVTGLAVVK